MNRDLSKFEPPKTEPDGHTKELFGIPVKFHCGVEESGFHAYNCNDCPNKCEEYYQWDKEMKNERN